MDINTGTVQVTVDTIRDHLKKSYRLGNTTTLLLLDMLTALAAELDRLDAANDVLRHVVSGLETSNEQLIAAGDKLVQWFDDTFAQACSNGLFDAWNRTIKCTLLNECSYEMRTAINEARK